MRSKFIDTVLTLGKVAVKSRPVGKSLRAQKGDRLIIMGNGPSLRDTIDKNLDVLQSNDTTAVNFAANTPEFFILKPRHYVLADPHFFSGEKVKNDTNIISLWSNLSKADWPITLHIPVSGRIPSFLSDHPHIRIQRFNMTPAEGYDTVCHWLFRKGKAMPRPRNVLIPAIMEGIRDGYEEIFLTGADHTWPHTLYVDNQNRVVTVQPHFYQENQKELDRIAEAYADVRIHDVLGNMAVAFGSYHHIRNFTDKEGVKIFNSTPQSLIDAFPRKEL